ncbi:MAG: DoxX family protein, partial [Candidatus Omnitrophica bacterium]|nr:DoxX family protein [Candidatus Omnitrophota bacterium]
MVDWAILVLRVGLGVMFAAHGLQKTIGLFGGPGVKGFSEMLSGLGFSNSVIWAYIAAYTELIGGICVVTGLFTRGAALLLLILIVVAAIKVHIAKGFFLSNGGFEYVFIIASICVALILLGPGKFSL